MLRSRLAAIAESATLAVDAKAKALKAAGEPVIGFGAGEPDFPTPAHIVEAAVAGLPRPDEPPLHARPPACPSCARPSPPRPCATRASRSPPRQVLVTNGGKHAVYNTFATLLDPGDEVLAAGARTGPPTPSRSRSPAAYPVVLPTDEADRLPGHRRAARGGPHRRAPRRCCSCRRQPDRRGVPARRGRGDRAVGRRARHLGHHRRDLRAPHLRRPRVPLDADARARARRPVRRSSTASPRPTP